jgi:5-aminopentanamidase
MAPTVRLALAQVQSVYYEKEANLQRADRAMREAAERGADAILFPEMFLTGYFVWDRVRELAEPLDGNSIQRLQRLSSEHRLLTVCGFPELSANGTVHNTACVIDQDGRLLGGYRKTHLFAEEPEVFSAGERFEVFETSVAPLGVLICYDVEFPEPVRALALGGARVVLVSTANMEPYQASQDVYLRSRALENGIFVAAANTIGEDERYRYFGQSAVADPAGRIIAQAGGGEEIVMADLDLAATTEAQRSSPYLDRRRPSLYAELARP